MKAIGVHHVSLTVSDVSEAVRFYTDVLGLTVRSDRPALGIDGAWLNLGDQQVHLIGGEPPTDRGQHFAVLVDDLASTADELRGRGVTVSKPKPIGTSLQSFLHDPSGNLIELHQANAV